ncbi:MAG: Rieske (2Fe-2S) protein [Geodermatophilaceae bacterium]|nr:Rieske (2Fe-2S) protein [Geodermatophilaceae bacterium]
MSDEGLSRRSVLRGAAVTAVAGVAGFAVAATSEAADDTGAATAANGYGAEEETGQRLAALADIPAGGGLILDGPRVVLTRVESGGVAAFSATCTHQGCTVSSIEDGLIVCPCHLSRFDLATGAPVSGPAASPLPPVAVEVRGEDVFII